jgi:predicted RND superfamily exporter protein
VSDLPLQLDPRWFSGGVASLVLGVLVWVARDPEWPVRMPRRVLAGLFVPTLLAWVALVRVDPLGIDLVIDPSTDPLLPSGDAAAAHYARAVRDFGDDQVFVVAMEVGDVFTAEELETLRDVGNRIAQLEGVRQVSSLAKVTAFGYVAAEDWVEVRPLIEDVPRSPEALAALRARVLGDPLYRRSLVSDDGGAAALNISFRELSDAEFIAADLDAEIRRIVAEATTPERRFAITGRPHIKSVMYHTMVRDLAVLIPVAFALIGVVLALFAGSWRGVGLPLATVALAVLWTFGAMAALERSLSILSVLLAPTLFAVGGVYGVHVVLRFEEVAPLLPSPDAAVRDTVRHMRTPVLVAGVTTMVGFGALMLSDVPAVFEVGAFSVLGVASITVLSLLAIPAVLALWPPHGTAGRTRLSHALEPPLDRALAALAGWSVRRSGLVLGIWAALACVALASLPRIAVDTDYLSFFDPESPVRQEFEAVDAQLSGAVPLSVLLEGGPAGHLREPDVLRQIESLAQALEALPEVGRVLSFLDALRALNRAFAKGDPDAARIPDTRAGVTELWFMLPKTELQRFATVDQSAANLVLRTGAVGSAALRDLSARIEAILAAHPVRGLETALTGNALLLARAADGVAEQQPRSVLLATAMIFALLWWVLRSPTLGLIAMVPNVVPVLLFFGALGLGAAPLSLPTSLIGCVALGIAIDATAHYLVRYRAEREAGASPEQAVLLCNQRVGRPVAIAAAMLTVGFGSVMASEFVTLQEFGALTAATMVVCALTDLTLLPALLVRTRA